MELKLQISGGNASGLITYLENYAKIRQSLLLEIDVENKCFVAKGLVDDRSAIRYSSLNFEDTNIQIVSAPENINSRIQVGILSNLDKFIKIVKRFDTYLAAEDAVVNIIVKFDYAFNDKKDEVLAATMISFKTKQLSMKFDCFKVSEFCSLPDSEFFNKIFHVTNEIRFPLTVDTIKNIVSTSDIVSMNARGDILIFEINNNQVSVMDKLVKTDDNGNIIQEPSFSLNIASLETSSSNEIYVPIRRETFIKMMGKADSNYEVIIGYHLLPDGSSTINRVLFESVTANTKVVISSVTIQ